MIVVVRATWLCVVALLGAVSGQAVADDERAFSGRVRAMDAQQGHLELDRSDGDLMLNASPDQLDALEPGQRISGRYRFYGRSPWLVRTPLPGKPAPASVPAADTEAASETGIVTHVDLDKGELALRTWGGLHRDYRAHPALLEGVTPGRYVTIRYRAARHVPWIDELE